MDFDAKSLSLSNLIMRMTNEYPGFNISYKADSVLMRSINWFLRLITFNKFTSFMDHYVTTVGHSVYVPATWDSLSPASRYIILSHEMTHMNQSKKYGKLLYSFLYLFMYIPFYRSYWRTKFEKEAYEATIKAAAEMYGRSYVQTVAFQQKIVSYFTGPDYFYMWTDENSIKQWVYDYTKNI